MSLFFKDLIDVFFIDESGFSLQPNIPYAWQPIGVQRTIRSSKDHVCNFYGLLSRKGKLKVFKLVFEVCSFKYVLINQASNTFQKTTSKVFSISF